MLCVIIKKLIVFLVYIYLYSDQVSPLQCAFLFSVALMLCKCAINLYFPSYCSAGAFLTPGTRIEDILREKTFHRIYDKMNHL